MTDILDSRLRRKIREHFLVYNNCVPVVIGEKVEKTGEIGGWFTNGGTPIAHPSAYAKNGWSNMHYRTDSREVEITLDWLRSFILSTKPYTS